jgi:drug/metabolite transporter (DMT)-like permease
MNWIIASSLMFVFSTVTYLLIRKCNFLKISVIWQNLALFIVPLILYSGLVWFSHISLRVTWNQLGLLVIMAIFFSYLGSVFSLKSIEYAPNPGYSLILSKSYVLFTTIAGLFLFHGILTVRSGLAIGLIILFSGLVMVGKPKTDQSHVRKSWLPLAIGSFFCWGMLAIGSKYLLNLGMPIYARLIYSMAVVTCLILGEMRLAKEKIQVPSKLGLVILFLVGVNGAAFNYFQQLGLQLAPNIGYINAINAASIAGVTLFSTFLFGDELTKKKLLGVLGITVGLILLVL